MHVCLQRSHAAGNRTFFRWQAWMLSMIGCCLETNVSPTPWQKFVRMREAPGNRGARRQAEVGQTVGGPCQLSHRGGDSCCRAFRLGTAPYDCRAIRSDMQGRPVANSGSSIVISKVPCDRADYAVGRQYHQQANCMKCLLSVTQHAGEHGMRLFLRRYPPHV